jgi:hypothetical protein
MHAYTVIGKTRLDDIRVEHIKAIMDAATEQSAPEAEVADRAGPQRRDRQWAARRHTRQPGSCEADKGGPPDKSLRRAPAIHGRSGSNTLRRAPSMSATNDALDPCFDATQP